MEAKISLKTHIYPGHKMDAGHGVSEVDGVLLVQQVFA